MGRIAAGGEDAAREGRSNWIFRVRGGVQRLRRGLQAPLAVSFGDGSATLKGRLLMVLRVSQVVAGAGSRWPKGAHLRRLTG